MLLRKHEPAMKSAPRFSPIDFLPEFQHDKGAGGLLITGRELFPGRGNGRGVEDSEHSSPMFGLVVLQTSGHLQLLF
jgi:hypothetical protein